MYVYIYIYIYIYIYVYIYVCIRFVDIHTFVCKVENILGSFDLSLVLLQSFNEIAVDVA